MEIWFSENHTDDVKLSIRVDHSSTVSKVIIRGLMCLILRNLAEC